MCQLTDLQVEKILDILKESELTAYRIYKDTGITQATIGNYRNGKTIPTQANALILKRYFGIDFADKQGNLSENSNSAVYGDNVTTDNSFCPESPRLDDDITRGLIASIQSLTHAIEKLTDKLCDL
ncbi:MAG: helix-turn-helix domain-containing protein [Bacteroidales bacterium]|nr:helix-turn-helix domain-containing protein [Bacteroidales bacterium]